MRRISSKSTSWYKRGFPALFFSWLALFMALQSFGTRPSGSTWPLVYVFGGSMGVLGYVVFRKSVFRFADGVFEEGNGLLVFHRGEVRRIAYREIRHLHAKAAYNPPHVIVTFTPDGGATEEFAFVPESNRFRDVLRRNLVVEALLVKVMRAHRVGEPDRRSAYASS